MKTHQIVYMVESNRIVRPVEIIKLVGNFAIVKFENGGGIQVSTKRLYETEEIALEVIPVHIDDSKTSYNTKRIDSSKYNTQML